MAGPASRGRGRRTVTLAGIAGSPGVAVGRTLVLDATRAFVPRRHVKKHQAEEELGRFDVAVARAAEEVAVVMEGAVRRLGKAEASILEAYGLMLRDETLREEVERAIRIDLLCVEWAVERVTDAMAAQLGQAADPYLAERSHDLAFVADLL
ncbi:MAG: phosphoenolpyruvate--protein phosphotransferase, partial [Deltaproteobacteria bacterium]|nr:phosphoenolpyruvate--protein phosphotransferase [Deltaproteobacteria bacterium]